MRDCVASAQFCVLDSTYRERKLGRRCNFLVLNLKIEGSIRSLTLAAFGCSPRGACREGEAINQIYDVSKKGVKTVKGYGKLYLLNKSLFVTGVLTLDRSA